MECLNERMWEIMFLRDQSYCLSICRKHAGWWWGRKGESSWQQDWQSCHSYKLFMTNWLSWLRFMEEDLIFSVIIVEVEVPMLCCYRAELCSWNSVHMWLSGWPYVQKCSKVQWCRSFKVIKNLTMSNAYTISVLYCWNPSSILWFIGIDNVFPCGNCIEALSSGLYCKCGATIWLVINSKWPYKNDR